MDPRTPNHRGIRDTCIGTRNLPLPADAHLYLNHPSPTETSHKPGHHCTTSRRMTSRAAGAKEVGVAVATEGVVEQRQSSGGVAME
jgi:hypothetical protein